MTRGGKMIYIIFVVDYSKFLKLNLPRTKYGDFKMFKMYKVEAEN